MKRSRQLAVGALLLSFAWVLASGCSSSDEGANPSSNGPGSGGSSAGTGGGQTIVGPGMTNTGGASLTNLNPLCGDPKAATCLPDSESSCRTFVPPATVATGGAGGEGGASAGGAGAGGKAGEGGVGGAPTDSAAGAAQGGNGETTMGGGSNGGGGGEGGNSAEIPQGLASYGCQVTRQNNQPQLACGSAGTGLLNAPCFAASDCAASFACVTEGDAGRCLPYCCSPDTICTSGSFCAERPLRAAMTDTSTAEPAHVPVCVPADGCSLEDPFPCPAGSVCRCTGDTACMVVRDGTTSCITPGVGKVGDACPCAWDHVCSSVTKKCIKICRTDATKNDCGDQKCQAAAELPENFGVCVGG